MKSPSFGAHLRDIVLLPVMVTVIVPLLIYDRTLTFSLPSRWPTDVAGVLFLLMGLILFLRTVFLFHYKGKGTLAPWHPTQKLVVTGPYRYIRNPMISGVLFILIGEGLFFRSVSLLIWAGCFFLINTVYFILVEEKDMLKRFGDTYIEYKKNVPRWVPRLRPYNPDSKDGS